MSLRDELLEERRKQKERDWLSQNATESAPDKNNSVGESYAVQFDALKRDVENGNIPAEWQDRYNALIAKIKKELSGSKEEFSITETVTQAYYEERARIRRGKESAVTLFNEYIAAQLKKEGFKNVVFGLKRKAESFSTQSDLDAYRLEQSRYTSEMGFYQYERDYLDPDAWDTEKPTEPILNSSGTRYSYVIYAAGSMFRLKQEQKNKILRLSRFSKLIPVILGVILAVAAMVYFSIAGSFFGIEFPVISLPYYAACGVGIGFAVRGIEWFSRKIHYGRLDDRLSAEERRKIIVSSVLLILVMIVAIGGLGVVLALPFIV